MPQKLPLSRLIPPNVTIKTRVSPPPFYIFFFFFTLRLLGGNVFFIYFWNTLKGDANRRSTLIYHSPSKGAGVEQ